MSIDNANHNQEKLVIGVLLFVGIATLVLGYMSINKSIVAPFIRPRSLIIKTAAELEQERMSKLKLADSDKDTVSDYDELYVFRTSPFLDDSDSDGTLDGKEIAAGADPNCAQGKTCRQARAEGTPQPSAFISGKFDQNVAAMNAAEAKAAQLIKQNGTTPAPAPTPTITPPTGTGVVTTTEEMNKLITDTFGDISKLTAEEFKAKVEGLPSSQIRQFMAKLGIPRETLDKTDDASLRNVVQEALAESMKTYSNPDAPTTN